MQRVRFIMGALLTASALAAAGVAVSACTNEFKCSKDYDCPATQVCNASSGTCEAFVCEINDDCADPTNVCSNNACIARPSK